jgi:Protein of unknown function (DUF2934)
MKRNSPQRKSAATSQPPADLPCVPCSENVIEQDALAHIREAAYQKWEAAGYPESNGIEFWLAAEREYLAAHAMPDPSGTNDVVQEASEESFPASDPPARTISPIPAARSSTVAAS